MTRDIDVAVLRDTVARLIVEANYNIPADILDALRGAVAREESALGRRTLLRARERQEREREPGRRAELHAASFSRTNAPGAAPD